MTDDLLPRLRDDEVGDAPAHEREAYRQLGAVIQDLAGRAPSGPDVDAWKARVHRAVEDQHDELASRRRRRRLWIASGSVGAAAAVIAVYVAVRKPPRELEVSISTEVRRDNVAYLGSDSAHLGDTLVVRGVGDGPSELRVYDDAGATIARCAEPASERCTVTRDGAFRLLRVEVALSRRGAIRSLLFVGEPLPPSTGSMNGDRAAAGVARVIPSPPTFVE